MPRCIIFANGTLPVPHAARRLIHPDDLLIAADGGTRHVRALGLFPSVVIGDLDSLAPADHAALKQAATLLIQHPQDKDETDLELALNYAIENGYREIVIVAALGGRLDQILGNLSLLADLQLSNLNIKLDDGVDEAFFVREQARIEGSHGDIVSLIPWGGEVGGVRTEGLRWPLSNEPLLPYKTRGISNEMPDNFATIQIESGLLLIFHRRMANTDE